MTALISSYNIRPNSDKKFKPAIVKGFIQTILNEELSSKQYNDQVATQMPKHISQLILNSLKELNLERYKYLVQVVIGEQRGQGVKIANSCMWDCDTDSSASDTLITDSLICTATVYAIYYY